jgi:hypothetical protein
MTSFENCGIHWTSKILSPKTHKLWTDNMDGSHCSLLCESDDISEIHRQWAIFSEMNYPNLSIETGENVMNKCLSLAEMVVESQMKLDYSDVSEIHVFDPDSMILKLSDGSFVIEQTFEYFDPDCHQVFFQTAYFLTDEFVFNQYPDHTDFVVEED